MLPFESNRAVGRNLVTGVEFEDDEDEEEELFSRVGDPRIQFIDELSRDMWFKKSSIILIRDKSAQILLSSLNQHFSYYLCGKVVSLSEGEIISGIYCSAKSSTVLLNIVGTVSDHNANKCAKLILDAHPGLVVVFDSYSSSSIVADGEEDISNYIRVLQTTTVSNEISPIHSRMAKSLEIGTVVDGLTAAIMCQAEYQNIPAISCFTVNHAAFSIRAAKAFESVWKLVKDCVGDSNLPLPEKELYVKARLADSYLLKTEALYT